jgi:predicted TIM-barrel fold metal-dependent hydrolase
MVTLRGSSNGSATPTNNEGPMPSPLIDPHHHLWDLEHNRYPWLQTRPLTPRLEGDIEPIARSYVIDDYLKDVRKHNVVKSVHVECGWDPDNPVGETAWLQSVADRHGFPHGIVARAELDALEVEEILAGHAQYKNTRGIRHIVCWHRDPVKSYVARPDLLIDSRWRHGFRLLRKFGFSFDLQLYPSQMSGALDLARSYPETLIILDHAGMPVDRDEEGIQTWRQGLRGLAAAPNVVVKISGLGAVDWHWTVESIRPFVLETIDIFGVDRCMFASNFPVDKLFSDFDSLYSAFYSITRDFSPGEKRRLFHDNAARYYQL